MLENEWKFARSGPHCVVCNAAFMPEQSYFSVLVKAPLETESKSEAVAGLLRQDYCQNCFQAQRPEDIFYFWKATPAKPDDDAKKRRPPVDLENVLEFFKRLEHESGAQKLAFRYILALMLVRKKVLVSGERKKDAAGRSVQLYREKGGGPEHAVAEPELSAEEISALSSDLGMLLGLAPVENTVTGPEAVLEIEGENSGAKI